MVGGGGGGLRDGREREKEREMLNGCGGEVIYLDISRGDVTPVAAGRTRPARHYHWDVWLKTLAKTSLSRCRVTSFFVSSYIDGLNQL